MQGNLRGTPLYKPDKDVFDKKDYSLFKIKTEVNNKPKTSKPPIKKAKKVKRPKKMKKNGKGLQIIL